jgi:predicted enzyme related to lactoylglutathione lyase
MTDERSHQFTRGLYGWITHTDLASTDPVATREWCAAVLGWRFQPVLPTPGGEYHLFAYSDYGGGGIRRVAPDEQPGSTPTVHVEDTEASYEAAIGAGAKPIRPPTKVMEGVCVAMVRAPGGVVIGFSGPTSEDESGT